MKKATSIAKRNPSKKEVDAAIELQAPQPQKALVRNAFDTLKSVARNAVAVAGLGDQQEWVKAENLFNDDYEDGLMSPPFYIMNAFRYESKEYGSAMGVTAMFQNGKIITFRLGYNENDTKRHNILACFSGAENSPVGPFNLVKLDLGRGKPYYDIRVVVEHDVTPSGDSIPF